MIEDRGFWSEALSKAQAVRVRNVMNPLLWLNAMVLPVFVPAAYAFREQPLLALPLIFVAVAVPVYTLWEFRYFARKDPKRLHSEEYLIEQQRLTILSKQSRYPIDASALPSSGNPELTIDNKRESFPVEMERFPTSSERTND
ncbi:hypothetical protein MesoLj131c_16360 [Mesorhizobium sp. 131-3-5]|nr:hypothetical protein MesoLj131c_16360 [Mesorhizobium sp. 131-3-5]